jgi:hypothetical protein
LVISHCLQNIRSCPSHINITTCKYCCKRSGENFIYLRYDILFCSTQLTFFPLALQPPWALASDFQFHDYFTGGRTSRTSDQLLARPLPKRRTAQTQNKHIHIPNIHALCGILTHDSGFQASEDSACLRLLGYRDRPVLNILSNNSRVFVLPAL